MSAKTGKKAQMLRRIFRPIRALFPMKPSKAFFARAGANAILSDYRERSPFRLLREPLAMQIHTASGYSGGRPLSNARLKEIFNAFYHSALADDWKSLVMGDIAVTFPDGVRHAAIDCRNTQFIALNRNIREFQDGYEPELMHLIDKLVPDDGVFLDIGSNWGYFSLYLATRPGFAGQIHAFEPIARSFQDLSSLVGSTDRTQSITCHHIALSDKDGEAEMVVPSGVHSGMAAIVESRSGDRAEVIRTKMLDDMRFERADFLKIDVEGHEINVLRGAQDLLAKNKPLIVFENWMNSTNLEKTLEPFRFLANYDYKFFLPGWIDPHRKFYLRNGDGPVSTQFALAAFDIQERDLLPSSINVLAVPGARLPELDRKMPR